MSEFMRAQYSLIFKAVALFLIDFKPYIPKKSSRTVAMNLQTRWMNSHGAEVNELVDILDTIVHTKWKQCQFTEKFVDHYFSAMNQFRQGIINHDEWALEIYKQYNSMRSTQAIAGLKGLEVEPANFG